MATADALVFENEEWLVTDGGLEHKETGYFIGRERLGDRRSDGLWAWPLHMAEKRWCTPAPFAEAFTCAAALYQIALDTDFARSFNVARRDVAGWPAALPKPGFEPLGGLRERGGIPISGQAALHDEIRVTPPDRAGRPAWKRPASAARRRTEAVPAFAALPWRPARPIRQAGTRLVRLLQAALSFR